MPRHRPRSVSITTRLNNGVKSVIQAIESAIGDAASNVTKPPAQGNQRIFVYGPLRRGNSQSNKLQGSTWLGHAEVDGFVMVHRPGGQAICPGRGTVRGDVYDADIETIRRLDRYHGMSLRRQRVVLWDGTHAWTWVWPQDMDESNTLEL